MIQRIKTKFKSRRISISTRRESTLSWKISLINIKSVKTFKVAMITLIIPALTEMIAIIAVRHLVQEMESVNEKEAKTKLDSNIHLEAFIAIRTCLQVMNLNLRQETAIVLEINYLMLVT
jgi:hypothetical protein